MADSKITVAAIMEIDEEMLARGGPGEKTRRFNEALIDEYRATGGQHLGELNAAALVLLTVKGAKTGAERTVPMGIQEIDGRLVVVASMSGLPKHPQWYHDLVANPIVTVELRGETFRAEAVVIEGDDRERLFGCLADHYHAKQALTTRPFPIVELRRLG